MATPDPSVVIAIESEEESTSMHELISDLLPLHWAVKGRQTNGKTPGCLVESLLKWLCANEQLVNDPIALTDLEIVFMLVADGDFCFPFQLDGSTTWTLKRLEDLFPTPRLSMLLRHVQLSLQHLAA